jgi:medium-chain acyl-[acyl-carrier-protein] hydrolase
MKASKLQPGEHGRYEYEIRGTDTDFKDQIQLHSLFSMMQEAASLSAADYGWGSDVTDASGTCWFLVRMSVRMTTRPAWLEKITIETWSRGADRLFFLRDFILYDEKGTEIGAGSSTWILANKISHRPVRPSTMMDPEKIAFIPSQALHFDPPNIRPHHDTEWITAHPSAKNTIVKYADFSEIDRNLHVNNTRYVAWCLDAAHRESLEQGDVMGIDINYFSEIQYGAKVVLFYSEDDSRNCLVDGYVEDGHRIAFSAILYRNKEIQHDQPFIS